MKKLIDFVKNNIHLMILWGFFILVLAVNVKINVFRYDNFDYGKFDLGNMNQMVWNTLNGRFMYLTDYFGTNLPRWAMSHVDPILVLFVPLFALMPHPMLLTYAQILLILSSCFLVYKIAYLELKSKWAATFLGISFLFYPAVGYITAWTGFHGVSAVIPFFFGAFYVFEKMYKENKFTTKGIVLFWILLVLTMSGKEQLPLYVILYGLFILLFRNPYLHDFEFNKVTKKWFKGFMGSFVTKLSLSMVVIGSIWFVYAFFILIPQYAHYRVTGFDSFVVSLGLESSTARDVDLPNYFLARYDVFGDSYAQVFFNMLIRPDSVVRVFFGGDRVDNLIKTVGPMAYLPLAYPPLLALSVPDFMINYLTSADGVGTSEITNHRISMIIPVLFISTIYAISFLSALLPQIISLGLSKSKNKKGKTYPIWLSKGFFIGLFSLIVLGSNVYMTFYANNPVFLWLDQAVRKKVFAKTIDSEIELDKLKVLDVVRLSELEEKDRECARKIVKMIPDKASVSGPDYLGAHLSLRETYAIFPALYQEADYVIVDVFSRKLLTILDLDVDLAKDVVERMIKSDTHELLSGCGNLFVFKKVQHTNKEILLPLQERFTYAEKFNVKFFQSLYLVDYNIPATITKGVTSKASFTYIKRDSAPLDDYVMFTSLVNSATGEVYQIANLPSFSILTPGEWQEDRYYIETVDIAIPDFLEKGAYKLFIGMGNNIRTRSMYLGGVEIK